jgi:hypothetical protein
MIKLESQWIVGFVDGEGCFHIGIARNKTYKTGYQVLPEFVIVQHARDVKLLQNIKSFFNCGVIRQNHGEIMCYRVRNLEHLSTIIIPFFEKHQLKSLKKVDFIKFRKIIKMMEEKKHLTNEGLEMIRNIRAKKFKIESNPLRKEEGED